MTPQDKRRRFADLHAQGCFVMPNPWDLGSTALLAHLGFPALATTSAGLAWSHGLEDYGGLGRDALVDHVRAVSAATTVPVNVDSERCFADDLDGVADTVGLLHSAGAAGCSIEDWNPATSGLDPIEVSVARVAAAAVAAHADPADRLVLTARCEQLLHGPRDLDATIERLVAYRQAGADCVYAPGLATAAEIAAVAAATDAPVNVLLWPGGPTVAEIAQAGGRRVSVGGGLASMAYRALVDVAEGLLATGTLPGPERRLRATDRAAFG